MRSTDPREALEDVEHAVVGVCIDAGGAVLAAMVETGRMLLDVFKAHLK